jgi:hypothetical protein
VIFIKRAKGLGFTLEEPARMRCAVVQLAIACSSAHLLDECPILAVLDPVPHATHADAALFD